MMERDAFVLGPYRYWLSRHWEPSCESVVWVLLNPSIADGEREDPTLSRVINFSKAWGYGGLVVVNLFAYVATDPLDLLLPGREIVGPRTDDYLHNELARGHATILAWGARGGHYPARVDEVLELVRAGDESRVRLRDQMRRGKSGGVQCLGTTAAGHPKHPLYLKAATHLRPFEIPQ